MMLALATFLDDLPHEKSGENQSGAHDAENQKIEWRDREAEDVHGAAPWSRGRGSGRLLHCRFVRGVEIHCSILQPARGDAIQMIQRDPICCLRRCRHCGPFIR